MRKYFGCSPPPVADAERNISLLILTSNWVFNYPIPLTPSVVTTHSLHVKTRADQLPNVSNKHSLSILHKICSLYLSAEHVADRDNSLAVKQVCSRPLMASVPARSDCWKNKSKLGN
jgi:hypothetical protein